MTCVPPPPESEIDYLRKIEGLSNVVRDRASDEGWLTYLDDDAEQSSLQQAINELARHLRHIHFEGDGCA